MMAEAKTADSKAPRLSALSANLSGKSLASTPSHSFFLAASKKETSLLSVPSTSQFEATSQSCSSVTSMMDKLNLGHAKHTRSTNGYHLVPKTASYRSSISTEGLSEGQGRQVGGKKSSTRTTPHTDSDMGIPQAARRKSSARSALWMEEDSRDSFECTRYKCLDLERQRAEYHTLVTRINKHPVDRACEKYAYDKQTEEERRRKLKKKEEINLVGNISEIFESFESDTRKPWLPGSCQQDASKPSSASRKSHKPQGIYAVRGIALTDCRELVGKESELLKRLLRTMRVKRWDPDLYFQMKFFEMRHKLPPFSQEKKEMIRRKWQLLTRMLRTLSRIDKILQLRSYEISEKYPALLDLTDASIKTIKYPSGVDHSVFKSTITGVIISIDAQGILRDLLPEERTEQDIEQVVTSLQYVDDFAKMAPEIQRKVVRGAWMNNLRSKRVVVRQGHVPQNIYFILSGQAVAKQYLPPAVDREVGLVRTTAVMTKGTCFGQLDLLNGGRRQSTVVTRTDVNLMVVSKEVLMTAILDPVLDPLDDPIVFLSKLWFMKGWPIEHLLKCAHQCQFRRYRRTFVIEKDTRKSEWIYVVKSGSVKLYKVERAIPHRRGAWSKPSPGALGPSPTLRRKIGKVSSTQQPGPTDENDNARASCQDRKSQSVTRPISVDLEKRCSQAKPRKKTTFRPRTSSVKKPRIAVTRGSECPEKKGERRASVTFSPKDENLLHPGQSSSQLKKRTVPSPSISPRDQSPRPGNDEFGPWTRGMSVHPPTSSARTGALIKSKYMRRKSYAVPKQCKPTPRQQLTSEGYNYPLIKVLRRLDVFGLEDIVLDPSVEPLREHCILLSDESECVMLKKAFYLNFADRKLRQSVLNKLRNPPAKPFVCELFSKEAKLLPDDTFRPIPPEDVCIHF